MVDNHFSKIFPYFAFGLFQHLNVDDMSYHIVDMVDNPFSKIFPYFEAG